MVVVNGDLFQDGLCRRVRDQHSCTQSPCPCGRPLLTPSSSTGDTQTYFWLSLCGVSKFCCAQVFFESSKCHWWVWDLTLNKISALLLSCLGLSFVLGRGVSFFCGIQHSPADSCSAPSCNFGLLPGEDEGMSFSSSILYGNLWSDSRNTEWGYPRDFLVPGKIESRWRKGPHCKKQLDGITN